MADRSDLREKFTNDPHVKSSFRPFGESNYKKLYVACTYKEENQQRRLEMLHGALLKLGIDPALIQRNTVKNVVITDPDEQAVFLWTLEHQHHQFYRKINRALLEDNPETLQHWIVVIRAINRFITSHRAPKKQLVYRGTKIKQVQMEGVNHDLGDEGTVFRQPWYVASSEDIEKATRQFCSPGSPLIEFEVPEGCWNCTPIPGRLSSFPSEKEWLMPPYTPVRWKRQRFETFPTLGKTLVVTFEVLDGMAVSRGQESQGLSIKSCLIMCELGMSVDSAFKGAALTAAMETKGGRAGQGRAQGMPPLPDLDPRPLPPLPPSITVEGRPMQLRWECPYSTGWKCDVCHAFMGRCMPMYHHPRDQFDVCVSCASKGDQLDVQFRDAITQREGLCGHCNHSSLLCVLEPCGHRIICPGCSATVLHASAAVSWARQCLCCWEEVRGVRPLATPPQ